jgi:thiol-disulfide isomerase/thioredoxin
VRHQLADYRGKVVLVNFWASWCPPCIKEMPGLQRLQKKLGKQPFDILAVNVGEQKYRVWKFTKLIDFTLPVLLDTRSETFAAWDASVLPTSFLLDTEGRIRYRVQGDLEWDSEPVVTLIRTLLPQQQAPE